MFFLSQIFMKNKDFIVIYLCVVNLYIQGLFKSEILLRESREFTWSLDFCFLKRKMKNLDLGMNCIISSAISW